MRTIILLATGALLALSPWATAQGQSDAAKVNALYRQGLLAVKQGQTETARACFQGVLRLQPNNTSAKYQLRQLELMGDQLAAKRRQLKLKSVTLPKVDFEDLTLPEALDAINAVVVKETKGEFTPNFVVKDPEDLFETRRFSLKLGQVPASVALKYALDSARATARYDEHAIVIKPLGGSRTESPEESDQDEALEQQPVRRKSADPFAR